jgi:hypothetical protein
MRPSVLRECPLDVDSAVDRAAVVIEGDEEAVAGVVDLLTSVFDKQASKRFVVPLDEILPSFVPDRLDEGRGLDDVGEEESPGGAALSEGRAARSASRRCPASIRSGVVKPSVNVE